MSAKQNVRSEITDMLVDNTEANVGAEIRDTTSMARVIVTVVMEATLEVI